MLVLAIILVPITKVSATSYTAKNDIIISSTYYDFYKAQFGEDKSYKFFAYDCSSGSYSRTCYYGIDKDNNYVQIKYNSNYNYEIVKGIDNNFSVSGDNVIEVKPSFISQLTYAIVFIFIFFVIYIMLGVIFL